MSGSVFTVGGPENRHLTPPVGGRSAVQGAISAQTGERGLEMPSMLVRAGPVLTSERRDDE